MSYLTSDTDQPRVRRAADVTVVVIGFVFILWGLIVISGQDGFQETLNQFVLSLPDWAVSLLRLGYTLGLIYAIAVIGLLVFKRRWVAIRDLGLAALAAGLTAIVLTSIYAQLWPSFFIEFQEPIRTQFPVLRVAVVTAVLVASSPYLARPIRRFGWAIVVLIGAAAVALALSVPSGVLASVGVGLIAGAGVLVIFGSPGGYPDVDSIRAALKRLSIDVPDLTLDLDQSWGVRRLVGTTTSGDDVIVKAYGRDASDSETAAKLWRAIMYRGSTKQVMSSRLQSVEHEALLTILASRAGVPAPTMIAAAAATDEIALLATNGNGASVSELDSTSLPDSAGLSELWRSLKAMHDVGIVHANLNSQTLRVFESKYQISDFSQASIQDGSVGTDLDNAQLLFTTASIVGSKDAVSAAAQGIGKERLAAALPYLQAQAMSRRDRRAVYDSKSLLKELRQQISDECDVEIPEPIKLRRFGIRQLLVIVLVVLFFQAMIPLVLSVNYSELWASLQNATWWIVILAIVFGQLTFIPRATAMMAAVNRDLPLRPMIILQPAMAFISFAVPGVAGRAAMEGAFLYKFGIAPAIAMTKGAISAFSGFIVQVFLFLLAFLTGALAITQTTDLTSSRGGSSWIIIALAVLAAIVVVLVVWKVPKVHEKVVPQIKDAWGALTEVLRSPKLALRLFGSQLAAQIAMGVALWLALRSLGTELDLIACTAVVVATSLLQGIVPVPGGIGISEAVMSAFLIPLGVPAEVALGASVIWRLATFYVPATEGFFASKYLNKAGYL